MHLYDISCFGTALKQLRESLGLTQNNVYCATGISEDTLRRIENAQAIPKLETLSYLSLMYKTNLIHLLNACTIFNIYTDSHFMNKLNKMIANNDYNNIQVLITEIDELIMTLNSQSVDQLLLNRLILLKHFIEVIKAYKQNEGDKLDKFEIKAQIIHYLKIGNADFNLNLGENANLNPIEIRMLLLYTELLRLEGKETEALSILSKLSKIAQKKQHYDPIFKELDLKISFNIAYCCHKLDQHAQVITICNQALEQCVHYNLFGFMHLFLFRKAIAQHYLKDTEQSQITYSECITLLKLTQQTELMKSYRSIFNAL